MTAATLELDAAARIVWDVMVVGAGPAGALAARELARRHQRVLLVDRARFPRWKVCGCCLNPRALNTLAGVGLGDVVDGAGATSLEGIVLGAGKRRVCLPLLGSVALSREALDTKVVEAAAAAGAAVLPGTRASVQRADEDGWQLLLQQDQRQNSVRARVVVAADGLGGTFSAGLSQMPAHVQPDSRIGAGAVAPTGPEFYEPGRIFMACGRFGYLGLVRLEDGRLDLAAALDAAHVRRVGSPAAAAAGILTETGWPAIPGITHLAWKGTPALTRHRIRLAGRRLFLVGDAAGYVEPFTGEGIAWALVSAVALVPLAARAVTDWHPSLAHDWSRLHHAIIARRQWACHAAARVLRHPRVARVAVALLSLAPQLATPFLRQLNPLPSSRKRSTHELRHPWSWQRVAGDFARPGGSGRDCPDALLPDGGRS